MKQYFYLFFCVCFFLASCSETVDVRQSDTMEPMPTESIPADAPELEWPIDFPSEMYCSIQIIENESYYAYLGCIRGLPHSGRTFYLSVVYKDGEREQWRYRDGDKTINGGRVHPPEYVKIIFGDEPNILWAYGKNEEALVELDVDTQEILWQYEVGG